MKPYKTKIIETKHANPFTINNLTMLSAIILKISLIIETIRACTC